MNMATKEKIKTVTLDQIKDQTDWALLRGMKDAEIAPDADNPIITSTFWKNAPTVDFPANKSQVTLRIDEDTLDWFKGKGKRYQGYINEVLKTFVQAQKHHASS
jgi:uncharacterized protein (DUF4415 family)